jgi:hypothetical protein
MSRFFNGIPTYTDEMLDGKTLKMAVVKSEGHTVVAGQDVTTGIIYVIKHVIEKELAN